MGDINQLCIHEFNMSDHDLAGSAWRIPPSSYITQRPITHRLECSEVKSQYVGMSDGCRLAVDVYLPVSLRDSETSTGFPTIVVFTPYTRRFIKTESAVEESPNTAKYRDFFVRYGYAVVVVDMRGTGASFGTRIALRSPRERDDTRDVARWIIEQPWSDGTIGATGISYLGAASAFLASTGHPAVKAVAPLFAVSDIYSEQLFPGGMMSRIWSRDYDELMVALDRNDRKGLERFAYFGDPRLTGPHPVDEDKGGRLLAAALREHQENFRLHDMMPELAYRDEGPVHDPSLRTDNCSPFHYLKAGVRPEVAIYSVSGWYDGGGYANGAISRYLSVAGAKDRLLLGPWDHGARTNISPWRDQVGSAFPLMAELLRFFDEHVSGVETGLSDEAPVHYYCVHSERWMSTDTWPPVPLTRYFLGPDASLKPEPSSRPGEDAYQVRFDISTGEQTRWERLGAREIDSYYPDWAGRDELLLNYDTEVFTQDTELSGHIFVSLAFTSSETDAGLYLYASEIEADGSCHYMTEGMLRALHRTLSEAPQSYRTCWPYRRFFRSDTKLLTPGATERAELALLPVSWCLKAGSRLRLSLGGADSTHFPQVPHGRPPLLRVQWGGDNGSYISLPIRNVSASDL